MMPAKSGREAADDGHECLGRRCEREQRRAARDHVNAGRDHRRGVDQGADGRGAFHGVGQPHVQRKLGALAASAGQQAQADQQGRACRRSRYSAGLASRV